MAGIHEIEVDELHRLCSGAGKVRVIDVRTPDEFAEVAADVVDCNIPLDTVSSAEFAKQGFADKNEALYLICRSGARSMRAAEFLAQQGYSNLTNIAGGTIAWTQAGYKTKK